MVAVPEARVSGLLWPALTGGLSAVAVFAGLVSLIERHRIRARREALRGRLFK